ncbi:hypothetical protein LENED_008998 [Lentinula edodes]|uniref:Uncharacterized protein n=1 Tax=Lentinula edodes TaxID=5353 RepID=A0A1Q3EIM7_LENED|nr:hypothetical protein LENED_008998 [Lentinula edodes]
MSGSFQLPNYSEVFPPSLDIDDIPPLIDSIQQGHRTPPYSLGWIISVMEAYELFGPTPPGERPISYYTYSRKDGIRFRPFRSWFSSRSPNH